MVSLRYSGAGASYHSEIKRHLYGVVLQREQRVDLIIVRAVVIHKNHLLLSDLYEFYWMLMDEVPEV